MCVVEQTRGHAVATLVPVMDISGRARPPIKEE